MTNEESTHKCRYNFEDVARACGMKTYIPTHVMVVGEGINIM